MQREDIRYSDNWFMYDSYSSISRSASRTAWRASAQSSLADFSVRHQTGKHSRERLQLLWDRHDGCVTHIADDLGLNRVDTLELLRDFDVYEIDAHGLRVKDLLPEDVGLSPLGCGQCGAEEIGGHPCPECGYDPRKGGASE